MRTQVHVRILDISWPQNANVPAKHAIYSVPGMPPICSIFRREGEKRGDTLGAGSGTITCPLDVPTYTCSAEPSAVASGTCVMKRA